MRRLSIPMVVVTVAFAGCEIFFPKVGGKGQPCADNGACESDLVCNFDECVTPREEGDECDDSWLLDHDWTDDDAEWLHSYEVCESGACCVNGVCAEDGDTVVQPDTNVAWSRCPHPMSWEDCHCEGGSIPEWSTDTFHYPMSTGYLCDDGMVLPTRDEVVALLGGCDSSVEGGGEGDCDPCEDSEECAAMFTFLDMEGDLVLFTSSFTNHGETEIIDDGWFVDLRTGEVRQEDLNTAIFDAAALCVEHD